MVSEEEGKNEKERERECDTCCAFTVTRIYGTTLLLSISVRSSKITD